MCEMADESSYSTPMARAQKQLTNASWQCSRGPDFDRSAINQALYSLVRDFRFTHEKSPIIILTCGQEDECLF